MPVHPNLLFIFADQLRACSLPLYGGTQIATPNTDRLAAQGVTFTNAISTCPVCTPYRSMLLTGRHPQTTGHLINFVNTRHDEISIGDAFSHAGYRTGWVGKWHLHRGSFPEIGGRDFVPEGRDRLGFEFWRGYNFHTEYFDGPINLQHDWRVERWKGYETDALPKYAQEFLDSTGSDPFCLFVSPHQPHFTGQAFAPQKYYDMLPETLTLPANVPAEAAEGSTTFLRHYLAMTLALDDMVGQLLGMLERTGKADNTIVIYTSDHGTQGGAHGLHPWAKKQPYEESILVPWVIRWPGTFEGGGRNDTLTAPVDIFPSLCTLCNVPIPRTVEGVDLSGAWKGVKGAAQQDALFTMNFTASHDYLANGDEWRGVRTRSHMYARWLNGKVELYDLRADPLQMKNLAGTPENRELQAQMESTLGDFMRRRHDTLIPCTDYASWFDYQRRVVRNVFGPLGDPEDQPDWSLLCP